MNIKENALKLQSHAILQALTKMGASDAEVYVSKQESLEVVLREGEIELAENAKGNGLSVRAYHGKKTAAASFSFDEEQDLSADMMQALEDLVLSAEHSPEDPYCGLADADEIYQGAPRDFDQYDDRPLLDIKSLHKRAAELEKAASGAEIMVDYSECHHGHGETYYAATNGLESHRLLSAAGQSVSCIHQGEVQTQQGAYSSEIYIEDVESIEETAKRAYERTWNERNPVRGPSGKFPILFDERVSSSLIVHLLSAMNASAIARRSSWLIDYDEPIFPQSWQLIETPFRMRKSTSAMRDAEGLEKKQQALVRDGRPEFWISNLSSSRQLDMPSTGHALGGGVNTHAGVASLRLEAKNEPREDLLKSMGEGLLVTGFIGATLNAHAGDYSRGVSGFWVRNGEIAEAVNEMTIASNLKTMLPSMRAADDALEKENYVVPSLLVEEMIIAGA